MKSYSLGKKNIGLTPCLTKEKIIRQLIKEYDYSTFQLNGMIDYIFEYIKSHLEKGHDVQICNFGKWDILHKKSRIGRNPYTGEKIEITSRKVVVFRTSELLREKINKEIK